MAAKVVCPLLEVTSGCQRSYELPFLEVTGGRQRGL